MDKAVKGVYTWEYIFSYKSEASSPSMNTTLGDLAKPVRELIDVLGNLGSIPPQFFPGFNISYWMPMIEALGTGYAQNMPSLVLRMLDQMDPLLRNDDFWKQMKSVVSAASQYMKWINDKLDMVNKQGQTIEIVKLFPDIDDVRLQFYSLFLCLLLSDV